MHLGWMSLLTTNLANTFQDQLALNDIDVMLGQHLVVVNLCIVMTSSVRSYVRFTGHWSLQCVSTFYIGLLSELSYQENPSSYRRNQTSNSTWRTNSYHVLILGWASCQISHILTLKQHANSRLQGMDLHKCQCTLTNGTGYVRVSSPSWLPSRQLSSNSGLSMSLTSHWPKLVSQAHLSTYCLMFNLPALSLGTHHVLLLKQWTGQSSFKARSRPGLFCTQ